MDKAGLEKVMIAVGGSVDPNKCEPREEFFDGEVKDFRFLKLELSGPRYSHASVLNALENARLLKSLSGTSYSDDIEAPTLELIGELCTATTLYFEDVLYSRDNNL